ncbi:enterotoxin [Granulicella sp. 5B5]|uniref:enterotoxin n=1 Tax=Granulicella sp. 5B5 TaxID=1617967 RepID=UPI0015F54210|nr:enterotoxin [Granulicella sp. 5B5]QMV18347.1 enterotoxin [Granulicella sp. 5B5]
MSRLSIVCMAASLFAFGLMVPASASAQGSARQNETTVHTGPLTLHVDMQAGQFKGIHLHDTISNRELELPEAFVLVLKDHTELRSSALHATRIADTQSVIDPHRALSGNQHLTVAEDKSCWSFDAAAQHAKLDWCLIARPHTDYVRSLLTISATGADLPITEVRLLDFTDSGARVDGTVKGSPIVDANMFFGLEHPLSISKVSGDDATASIFRDLPLRTGQSITYSAVLGTTQLGQLRRGFLSYIEAERPRPYEPFLHYNSWFDLGYENRFDEKGALDRVNAFGQELVIKRHVKLDSYLFDDGWDDPNTLWGFNPGFPDGFTKTGEAAAKYHAGIGVWLSPWGGYAEQKKERIAYGRAHGYEILNNGYALSGPKYYDRFQQTCLNMIDKYHVNQFKFDGTGNADRVFPGSAFDSDFDAAIHLIERLRKEEPQLFVNLTTGTTASPFWLFYADSIWRGGADSNFSGVGSQRQRWITYRDAQTYKNIVQRGPLYPLNSLMLHGLIYAKQAKGLSTDPNNDFADEVHSYFGGGTQLQEMYITPSLLTPANWDTLADAARWSREHSSTLKDTHWVGGDPDKLQVYGWAAWSPKLGILTLRNPSQQPQTYTIDAATAFQLPTHAPTHYIAHAVWGAGEDWQPGTTHKLVSGEPLEIKLAPFQVLTIEATPKR